MDDTQKGPDRQWKHNIWVLIMAGLVLSACTMKQPMLNVEGLDQPLAEGTIVDTASGQSITFDQLIRELGKVRVVYVGERHTESAHHKIQLQIIQALVKNKTKISVGMEMFDHTYQDRLNQWSAGEFEWPEFLKQVHWYANWRFDDTLYKDILIYVQSRRIKLIGINIPFNIPPKIAVGGIGRLRSAERALLPDQIDTSDAEHRAYVEKIFKMHKIKGRNDFENFYAAQCTWEDGMAQTIADHLGQETMVVLAGNGHIQRKYGIPNRALARTQAPFRTVYLATVKMEVSRQDGDFIWVTPLKPTMPSGHHP